MNRRNLFDRISLYRWSAAILTISVIRSVYTEITQALPSTSWRVVLWAGWLVLMLAVYRDFRTVYRARREIQNHMDRITREEV